MLFSFRPVCWLFAACEALAVAALCCCSDGFCAVALCAIAMCCTKQKASGKKMRGRAATPQRLVCCGFYALAQALAVPVGWLYFLTARDDIYLLLPSMFQSHFACNAVLQMDTYALQSLVLNLNHAPALAGL